MSTFGRRAWRREREAGDLRSSAMEVLRRVRRSDVGGGGGEVVEWAEGEGRSMRRTEAP
jgi:hypothetical protein